jgi:hypothetical protein
MRVSEPKIIDVKAAVHSKCCHHWVIDTSEDTDSKGRCKLCGEERTFRNEFSRPPKGPEKSLDSPGPEIVQTYHPGGSKNVVRPGSKMVVIDTPCDRLELK